MKLLIDLQPVQASTSFYGIGRVAAEVTKRILNLFNDNTTLLFNSYKTKETIEFLKSIENKSKIKAEFFDSPNFKNYFEIFHNYPDDYIRLWKSYEMLLEYKVNSLNPDIYLIPSFFQWDNVTSMKRISKKIKKVVIAYDLIPYIFSDNYLTSKEWKAWYHYKVSEFVNADFYLAISENTGKDLVNYLNIPESKIEVVHLGHSSKFRPMDDFEKKSWKIKLANNYGVDRDFILYNPSNGEKRKNIEKLLDAFALLPDKIKKTHYLVLTSKIDKSRKNELISYARKKGLDKSLVFTGYVSDEELAAFYNLCKLFVFPSYYEGFGLPIVEAMACHAPVIGSNLSSIPEIIGEKEALFNPYDEREIANKIQYALENQGFLDFLSENSKKQVKRFSWDKTAEKILNTILKVATQENEVYDYQKKLKLAIVCPSHLLSDELLFSREVLDTLSEFYSITLVVDGEKEISRDDISIMSSEKFLREFSSFDRILYYIDGTNEFMFILQLIEEIPGCLLMKCMNLSNLFKSADKEFISKVFYYSHGYSSLLSLKERGLDSTFRKYHPYPFIVNKTLGVILPSKEYFEKIKSSFLSIREEFFEVLASENDKKSYALKLKKAIEKFYSQAGDVEFLRFFSKNLKSEKELIQFSRYICRNSSKPLRKGRILFDVSVLSKTDAGTGIQRVVKAQLTGLIKNPPEGYIIEPVRLCKNNGGLSFVFAREFMMKFLGMDLAFKDEIFSFERDDIYYAPDLNHSGVIDAFNAGLYDEMKLRIKKIVFLIYDILPVRFPNYFPSNLERMHREWLKAVLKISDKIICISNVTLNEVIDFSKRENLSIDNLELHYLHIGADFKTARHSEGLREEIDFTRIQKNPYFLVVSTIEPRKGHYQVLKAFEILWEKGYDYNLVFAGNRGWMVEDLVNYMQKHPENGKRFYWLGYVSDETLEKLYSNALATIVSSEGEGFGLAVVEAAMYNSPVITRDIPVFREIAEENAFYFPNTKNPADLADSILLWLRLYSENKHPKPENIKYISWEENCEKLKEILIN